MARLRDRYDEEIALALKERFGIENPMRIPRLEKIVVNMGVGEAAQNSRALDGAMEDLARITGQKAQMRRARKSIAGFKIREGMPVGARVTLRGERMWEFLDRLISVALPRVRDFRGVSPNSFDGHGNFALGLREQLIFPEISYDAIDTTRGLDVAVVTTTESDEEARELLRPFNLEQVAGRISCPILISHGDADAIMRPSSAERLYGAVASSEKQLRIWTTAEGGAGHCNYDKWADCIPFMFDWLADRLHRA